MKIYRAGLALVFVSLLVASAKAQDSHVHSEYKEQLKATIVYTDKMYVLSTPEQVVDVEFNFRLKKGKAQGQPERVDVMVWSYSHALKYQKDSAASLSADGDALKAYKVIYMPLQGVKKDFERIKDAYAEWIILYLNPDEAKRLATAKEVRLQIGGQEFNFTENQTNTIRDFAGRIPAR